jgi:16S rRNA (adenine1518-N6/adenine1519-N6)-dimethyltransferase
MGAGTGSLTDHLLQVAPLVHAVERDRDLVPLLKMQFQESIKQGKLVIHEADGARFDLTTVFSFAHPGLIVGNLPYHLTSSIILLTLRQISVVKGAVFLVQKEVADRLVAKPNTKQYGFLTVVLHLFFTLRKIANVDKQAFWPVPQVDSAIIRLETLKKYLVPVKDMEALIVFVREIFQKRRKKLSTILSDKIPKEDFFKLGIDGNLRPEDLTPDQFLVLFASSRTSHQ